jgi:glycerol uptake facilitator-like aquaporin
MMKPALFLRMAAVLTFIHAVLHTIGGVFSKPGPGPANVAFQAMKLNQFLLMGHTRSYADFYRGLGLMVTICLTAEAVFFWQLGSLAQTDARRLRPILATFLVAYAALAANSYAYFFLAPVITEILIAACLGLAFVATKSPAAAYAHGGI